MKQITKKIKLILFSVAALSLPGEISAQIADGIEIAALLDFYNSTSNNDLNPWTTNLQGINYRWNREKLLISTNFDDFNLVLTGGGNYTTPELRGVTLNAAKDVIDINLSTAAAAKGSIPASFNNLSALKSLNINSFTLSSPRNEITGVLPNLSGLINLESLNLPGNDCTGVVDWLGTNGAASNKLLSINLSSYHATPTRLTFFPGPAFANLTQLQSLTLTNNEFTTVAGPANNLLSPHFEFLDALTGLSLQSCGLTSTSFPTQFGTMSSITSLNLSGNPIQNVPTPIGNLTTLTNLTLSSVNLQTLPSNFGQLDNLLTLDLSSNSLTNNTAFLNIIALVKDCAVVNYLNLYNNGLSELSTNFNLITSLRTLNLSLNPVGTSDLINLQGSLITSLNLDACNLTTKLPSTLINLSSLQSLSLTNSPVGLSWPTHPLRNALNLSSAGIENVIKNLQHLKILNMNYHAIAGAGPLPAWFGTGYMNLFETINLSENQIQFPIPANFYLMDELKTLWLNNNSLSGPLPVEFNCTALPKLENLVLASNQLTSISAQQALPDLSGCTFLRYLDIGSNQFSGDVPDYLRQICTLNQLNISSNNFVHLPDFKVRPVGCSNFGIYAYNNYFDFEDMDRYYNSACNTTGVLFFLGTPQKLPQGVKGNAASFSVPEGFPVTLQFQAPGVNNYYQWEKEGIVISPFILGPPIQTNDTYYIPNADPGYTGVYYTKIRNKCLTGLEFRGNDVTFTLVPPLCQSEIPATSGTFKLDKLTGSIVFERADCTSKIPVSCVFGPASTLDNVVSAKATTHSDDWSTAFLGTPPAGTNPFSIGERGKWRSKSNYVYNTQLVHANDKSYNGGTFKYKPFNWKTSDKSNNPGWIRVNDVLKYTPNGDAVEERNAMDIKSTAKFGYKNAVPYLIAQNADYQSVLFESFENSYIGGKFEDEFLLNGGTLEANTGISHSGKNSFKITGASTVTLRSFAVTGQTKVKGIQAKLWVKGTISSSLELQVVDAGSAVIGTVQATWIASSGDWALYETLVQPTVFDALPSGANFTLKIRHTGSVTIWIDDVRIQPGDSEMTAYVYDASSLRLLAVLDDQHFALFYQYNAEGKLIRKMVETERGIKTIQETQYNTPKVIK